MPEGRNILVIAGEVSGDMHAAGVIAAPPALHGAILDHLRP